MDWKYVHRFLIWACFVYIIYNSEQPYIKQAKELGKEYGLSFFNQFINNPYVMRMYEKYYSTNIRSADQTNGIKMFTADELAKYSNIKDGLYISILGKIYDVTNGAKFYGPGGSYHGFVGRDASLAFITGDFSDAGLTDDLSSLSPKQVVQLTDWTSFYDKTYIYKGKLKGRFYDENGNPTREYDEIIKKSEQGKELKMKEEMKNTIFPPCNIEWKAETGTRVWCTKQSGGVSRDWTGVPRILFEKPNSKVNRCACVKINSDEYQENKAIFGTYQDCLPDATSCTVKI